MRLFGRQRDDWNETYPLSPPTYQWAVQGPGGYTLPAGGTMTDPSLTFIPSSPGAYTVSVTATDTTGLHTTASTTVGVDYYQYFSVNGLGDGWDAGTQLGSENGLPVLTSDTAATLTLANLPAHTEVSGKFTLFLYNDLFGGNTFSLDAAGDDGTFRPVLDTAISYGALGSSYGRYDVSFDFLDSSSQVKLRFYGSGFTGDEQWGLEDLRVHADGGLGTSLDSSPPAAAASPGTPLPVGTAAGPVFTPVTFHRPDWMAAESTGSPDPTSVSLSTTGGAAAGLTLWPDASTAGTPLFSGDVSGTPVAFPAGATSVTYYATAADPTAASAVRFDLSGSAPASYEFDSQYVGKVLGGTGDASSASVSARAYVPLDVGFVAHRTGLRFGSAVSPADQSGGDPAMYTILVDDAVESDPAGLTPDNGFDTVPVRGGQVTRDGQGKLLDDNLAEISLPQIPAFQSGTFGITLSNESNARLFDDDGNLLTQRTLDLADPAGPLAGLLQHGMNVWVQGMQTDPDFTFMAKYAPAGGTSGSAPTWQSQVHVRIADFTLRDSSDQPEQFISPSPEQVLLDAANGLSSNPVSDSLSGYEYRFRFDGLAPADVGGVYAQSIENTKDYHVYAPSELTDAPQDAAGTSSGVAGTEPVDPAVVYSTDDPSNILGPTRREVLRQALGVIAVHNSGNDVVGFDKQEIDGWRNPASQQLWQIDPVPTVDAETGRPVYKGQDSSPGPIPNPAVIVNLYSNGGSDPDDANVAKIELTKVPKFFGSVANLVGDPHIYWTVTGEGQVSFYPNNDSDTGSVIRVYGVHSGPVTLHAWYRANPNAPRRPGTGDQSADTLQALVADLKTIPFRVQLTRDAKGDDVGKRTTVTVTPNNPGAKPMKTDGSVPISATDAMAQIARANQYLYQLGVELVPDTDTSVAPGGIAELALDDLTPGYFNLFTGDTPTNLVPGTIADKLLTLNHRPGVLQIMYVSSIRGGPQGTPGAEKVIAGECASRPAHANLKGPAVELAYKPEVNFPSNRVQAVAFNARALNGGDGNQNWGIFLSSEIAGQLPGYSFRVRVDLGLTLAHEFGHFLGLRHRGPTDPYAPGTLDGLNVGLKNIMTAGLNEAGYKLPQNEALHFDLAQAYIAHDETPSRVGH